MLHIVILERLLDKRRLFCMYTQHVGGSLVEVQGVVTLNRLFNYKHAWIAVFSTCFSHSNLHCNCRHPDKTGQEGPYLDVVRANEALNDEESKEEYDDLLKNGTSTC